MLADELPLTTFFFDILLFVRQCLIAFGATMIKLSKGSTYINQVANNMSEKKRHASLFLWATTRELETMWCFNSRILSATFFAHAKSY